MPALVVYLLGVSKVVIASSMPVNEIIFYVR